MTGREADGDRVHGIGSFFDNGEPAPEQEASAGEEQQEAPRPAAKPATMNFFSGAPQRPPEGPPEQHH